jgi:hypothetical protein
VPQPFLDEHTAIFNPVFMYVLNLCTARLEHLELKDSRPPLVLVLLSDAVIFDVFAKKWVHFTLERGSIANDNAQGPIHGIAFFNIDGASEIEDFDGDAKTLFHETPFGVFKVDWLSLHEFVELGVFFVVFMLPMCRTHGLCGLDLS